MRKVQILVLLLVLVFGCRQNDIQVERMMEDGVEVVVNHPDPYVLPEEKTIVSLENECKIDLEDPIVSDIGLYDINVFGVDSIETSIC